MSLPKIPSLTSYAAVKVLTDAVPVINVSQEWAATYINQLRNDVTGLSQGAVLARFQVLGVASGTPQITPSTTWGSGIYTVYQDSPVPITFVRNSTGNITVTLPSTCQDFLGNTGVPLNYTEVNVSVQDGTTALGGYTVTRTSSTVFTVQLLDTTNTANDFVGSFIIFTVKL